MKRLDHVQPPRLADTLFKWFCANAAVEDLHGDAQELFHENLTRMSVRKAKIEYWKSILSLIFSYSVKRRRRDASVHALSAGSFNPNILKNYLVVASRSLAKHRFFTIINVFGLAVGMSVCLLFIALLSFLWRYDNFHVRKDNLFRVISHVSDLQRNPSYASAPSPIAFRLREEAPGIEEVVRISSTLVGEVSLDDRKVPLSGYFVDPNFLQVFTFPLVRGDARTALRDPRNLLMTERASLKFFGREDPMGRTITMGGFGEFTIVGILQDIPKNSHMQFEILGAYPPDGVNVPQSTSAAWREFRNSYVYLLLSDQANVDQVNNFLANIGKEMYPAGEDFRASFELQSVNSIAPGMELQDQIGPDWGYGALTIFGILTALILFPACSNYTNISISRALRRMKEIGIRKVMGGQQEQIFVQFILETILTTLIALVISYYVFTLVRQEFLEMIVNGDAMDLVPDGRTIFYFIAFALVVGIAAGAVPAVYFSRLSPLQALKNKPTGGQHSGFGLRKILIVFQFALSLGFILGVVIIISQYRQSINYDLGFQQSNLLDVELQGTDAELFKTEFSRHPAVQSISLASHVVGTGASSSTWIQAENRDDSVEVNQLFVDHNYIPNLELTMLAGKNFSEQPGENLNHVIVNEEFLRTFNLDSPQDALNRIFRLPDQREVVVIGVVKNFHYQILTMPIRSFFFRYDPRQHALAHVRLQSRDLVETMAELDAVWKTVNKEKTFSARFFKDEIEETYAVHFSMVKICGFLGLLAVTISCLGLLGMVVFTTENRIKEVGIRKVMGATAMGMTLLLSKDFLKLMGIAAVIATPLAYLFFDRIYLRFQYYKAEIGILEISVGIVIMTLLGLGAILSQTIKAAKTNPVDTLRYE